MPAEPTIKPLSRRNREWTFRLLFAAFCIAVPVFVFYAVGYRIDFGDTRNIVTVGGMYVSADADDVQMFVDEAPVTNMRIFQQAAYIQNLEAGIHRIHVQRDGLQTWVKELPVYSHIVTEAAAFNMPETPQIRYISEWLTESGVPVLVGTSLEEAFPNASTTNLAVATTTRVTNALSANAEFEYVESLFIGTSTEAARSAVEVLSDSFTFDTDGTEGAATGTATTTKVLRDVRLFEANGEVYAEWRGPERSIPYYYCVTYTSPATTTREYGEHVYASLVAEFGTSTDLTAPSTIGLRLCRDTIRIDRDRQDVRSFDFLPGSMHHVLMLLTDGLYVVEIDDRAWQNMQLLYPGEGLDFRVDGGRIYLFDGTHYFEVLTETTA